MSIKIVSFSATPLAGAPIRIAQALNRHTDIDVRHVDLKRWGSYDHDHVHEENPELTLALAQDADILQLFNILDAQSAAFAPVDFAVLQRQGKRLVRMFESTPMLVASQMGIPLDGVLNDPIPKMVIAQYPERFLPTALVVPNIIPQDDPAYCQQSPAESKWGVVYCPTRANSAWDERWDTKGMPETVAALRRVQSKVGRPVKVVHGRPLGEVMATKRDGAIIVDDLVTGSYHLSGLEGLSLGKPVVAFLDERVKRALSVMTGTSTCPFINTRLEDVEETLCYLLTHDEKCQQLGQAGREWIEAYYNDAQLVEHYVNAYHQLLEDPSRVTRQPELALDSILERFWAIDCPDMVYESRRKRWLQHQPLNRRILRGCGIEPRGIHAMIGAMRRLLPHRVKAVLKRSLRIE